MSWYDATSSVLPDFTVSAWRSLIVECCIYPYMLKIKVMPFFSLNYRICLLVFVSFWNPGEIHHLSLKINLTFRITFRAPLFCLCQGNCYHPYQEKKQIQIDCQLFYAQLMGQMISKLILLVLYYLIGAIEQKSFKTRPILYLSSRHHSSTFIAKDREQT